MAHCTMRRQHHLLVRVGALHGTTLGGVWRVVVALMRQQSRLILLKYCSILYRTVREDVLQLVQRPPPAQGYRKVTKGRG